METTKQSSKDYFKAMHIMFFALLAGQVMFALIVLIFSQMGIIAGGFDNSVTNIFFAVNILFIGSCLYASNFVFQNKMKSIYAMAPLSSKLVEYRSASIIKWALLEGPSFLSIIFAFLTGNLIFLGLAVMVMIYFLTMKPGAEKAATEMGLDFEQKNQLSDPETLI
jgi:hypothetical protein